MEIRGWLCFISINCVVLQCINAKSVSLNELIAAESQLEKQHKEGTPKLRITEPAAKSVSSNKIGADTGEKQLPQNSRSRKISGILKRSSLSERLASRGNVRRFKKENTISGLDKIISPLKYRKTFLIKSPLRPKKLKLALKSRHKRKNQATKREISGNEGLKHKYIPLLKSLSMLVDNLLSSAESDSNEVKRKPYKRNRYYFEDQFERSYEQSSLSSSRNSKPKSKKTTTPSPTFSTEISSDTESFPNHENNDDSTHRSHKSIPVLLPRNTFSLRRDDHGPSQRSGAAYNGDPERDISRNHRDYEYNTGCAENNSCEEGDENDTYGVTRNDASGVRYARTSGNGNNTRDSKVRKDLKNVTSKIENANDTTGADQFEIGRNKTESKDSVRESIRRLSGSLSEDKGGDERLLSEPIQLQEVREESVLNATKDSTGDKRITDQNGPFPTEDEKTGTGNETVTLIERSFRPNANYSTSAQKKRPVVLIFDGYSVTRDKNGENKLSGKTIHIRS